MVSRKAIAVTLMAPLIAALPVAAIALAELEKPIPPALLEPILLTRLLHKQLTDEIFGPSMVDVNTPLEGTIEVVPLVATIAACIEDLHIFILFRWVEPQVLVASPKFIQWFCLPMANSRVSRGLAKPLQASIKPVVLHSALKLPSIQTLQQCIRSPLIPLALKLALLLVELVINRPETK